MMTSTIAAGMELCMPSCQLLGVEPAGLVCCLCMQDQIHQQQFFYWQHYLSNRAKAQGQEQGVDAPSAVATEQSSAAVPAS
jgi:hypothetical protein